MTETFSIDKEQIEGRWPLTNVGLGEVLQKSGKRVVGKLTSDQGVFVYKVADPSKSQAGVEKDTAVFDELRQRGFTHAPTLFAAKDGTRFQALGSSFVYLLDYIDGKRPEASVETYAELGRITAELHGLQGYPLATDLDTERIRESLVKDADRFSFGKEYAGLVKGLPDFNTLPKSVIHTDIAPNNSVQTNDGKIIFVDWDDAGIGPTVLDFGAVVNEIIKEEPTADNEALIQAFFDSYRSHRPISPEERSHVLDAALFYALDYITYGDIEKRWQRIQWMIRNRERLEKYW